ncbi:MAG: hypothetical protein Q8M98_11840 [Candidatus Cloacimonadaceae bacterium]|nr:hypothetical protein [Candidatus Cloacimonadaceae bacterium]
MRDSEIDFTTEKQRDQRRDKAQTLTRTEYGITDVPVGSNTSSPISGDTNTHSVDSPNLP